MGNDVDIMTIFRSNSRPVAPYGVQKFSWDEDRNELNDLAEEEPELLARMIDKWYAWAWRTRVLPKGEKQE